VGDQKVKPELPPEDYLNYLYGGSDYALSERNKRALLDLALKIRDNVVEPAKQFYHRNQSDIDAILNYPGDPIGPILGVALNPKTYNLFVKTYETLRSMYKNPVARKLYDTIREGTSVEKVNAGADAMAYLAARYPRIARKFLGEATDIKMLPDRQLGYYDPEVEKVAVSPSIFANPSMATNSLAHELTHMAQYRLNLPESKYVDYLENMPRHVYKIHPMEVAARAKEVGEGNKFKRLYRAVTGKDPKEGPPWARDISPEKTISSDDLKSWMSVIEFNEKYGKEFPPKLKYKINPVDWANAIKMGISREDLYEAMKRALSTNK
jgi:hypothetical protein